MVNSVLEQRQQHYQPRLQISRLCEQLEERIAKKRWEFQHTSFDPLKLWTIANEVGALNWVLRKVQVQSGMQKSSPENITDKIIIQLKKELLRIERYLVRPNKVNFESRGRLKSRASAIEWTLFQIHFLLAETLQEES